MPTTESSRRNLWIGVAIASLALVIGVVYWWRIPPQMGPSEEVFDTVDALFTAVTAHDEKRLGECETRLKGLADSGKMTGSAWRHVNGIISTAKAGSWQSAAESLYDFMLAQKREGFEGHSKPIPTTKKKLR